MYNLLYSSYEIKMIKPGIYRHFKGGEYKVLGVAKHSENLEDLVVYIHFGEDSFGRKDGLWVRPLAMFSEEVEKDGQKIPRFSFVREE